MANLSQKKRQRMLAFLNALKEKNKDDDKTLAAVNEIENALNEKKYGLVWEQHEEKVDVKMKDNIPVFTEDHSREITAAPGEPYNFLLEGDNLHSLYLLEKTHKGKIDVIYIDPPYNTGNKDFKYDDAFVDADDSFRHSKWLSFMEKRLKIAKNLLKINGFIGISIDDNEYAQLKCLCDEIFGEDNFLSSFHVQVRYPEKNINESKIFKPLMEYILLYSRDSHSLEIKQREENYGLEKFCYEINELSNGTHFTIDGQEVIVFKKGEWKISKTEGNLKGLKETWVTGSIYTTMSYGKVFQSVVEPRVSIDGLGCLYKVLGRGDDGLGYRYYTGPQRATAKKGKMYSGVPLDKVALFQNGKAPKKKIPIVNLYDYAADFGNIRHEGDMPFSSGKKPVKMIKQLLKYSINQDALVLDFFAGSGSTGHAVMELNHEDKGHRRFILCTNNENKICEDVTYPRLKTVITGKRRDGSSYSEGIPANLKYYRTDFVSRNEEFLSDALLLHVAEMIQLEHGVKLDGKRYLMVMSNDEADRLAAHWADYPDVKTLYVSNDVLFTTEEKRLFQNVEICIIPDYYFNFELQEAGESW